MAQMRRELPKAVCGIAVTSVTDYQARVTRDLVHGTEEAVTLPKSNVLVLQLGEKGTGASCVRPARSRRSRFI